MCDCLSMVNRELAKHNTHVDLVDTINMTTGKFEQRMAIPTARTNTRKRGSPMKVFATFCPMCGEKYPETGGIRPSHNADTHGPEVPK
jgi:hypothetical protein